MLTNMQTVATISAPIATHSRRRPLKVQCYKSNDVAQSVSKTAAAAAAAIVLSVAPYSDAAVKPRLSAFEKQQAYQAELFAALKARTGKSEVLPDLKSSPTDEFKSDSKAKPLKFEGGIAKVKLETPERVPAPAAAVPAEVAPPAKVAAPSAAVPAEVVHPVKVAAPAAAVPAEEAPSAKLPAPEPEKPAAATAVAALPQPAAPQPATPAVSASAPASNVTDNKGLLVVGGVLVVAAGAVAAGNNNGATMEAAGGSAAAVGGDVPSNVAEARAWIAAWKKKHGKA